jgi:hypothetical protein
MDIVVSMSSLADELTRSNAETATELVSNKEELNKLYEEVIALQNNLRETVTKVIVLFEYILLFKYY